MRIMKKLLGNLGNVWNTLPKEVPFIEVQKGSGTHTMVTIKQGIMYLHSTPYHAGIPTAQEIILDGLPAQELINALNSMGYAASFTSEATKERLHLLGSIITMEVENAPLPTTLNAFTSNTWRLLYPIYRVLQDVEADSDLALKQLYRDMASGIWLDYWADFFSIRREAGESDEDILRRFTTWLFNPKNNNVALKELLAYRLKDNNIDVRDLAPAQMEIIVDAKYTYDDAALHKIIRESKAAGVEYFLNYISKHSEDYRFHVADIIGKPFEESDTLGISGVLTFNETNIDTCFTLNASELGIDELFDSRSYPMPAEAGAVVLTENGEVIQQVTL